MILMIDEFILHDSDTWFKSVDFYLIRDKVNLQIVKKIPA